MRGDHFKLPLLGNRDYVNGATIFTALLDEMDAEFPIDLRFQTMVRGIVKFGPVWDGDKPNAIAIFQHQGNRETLGIYDAGGYDQLERLPWDETAIATNFVLEKSTISADHGSDILLIQRLVVMNKVLMSAIFPKKGKWILTRIDVQSWGESAKRASLTHEGGLGSKLTKARIDLDGKSVGHLYFSLALQ